MERSLSKYVNGMYYEPAMCQESLHRKGKRTYLLVHCSHLGLRKTIYLMNLSVRELLSRRRSDIFCYRMEEFQLLIYNVNQ